MNRLEQWIAGYAELEITGASIERCLTRLSEQGISFRNINPASSFAVRLRVRYRDRERVMQLAQKAQCDAVVKDENPGIRGILTLRKRPLLVIGLLFAMISVTIFPDYVWVITVSGNEEIPDAQLIQALDELGVRFGTKNETIDSQTIKNQLLNRVDGLQWAAVNCRGGVCELQVKERDTEPELVDRRLAADVVASCDGTIVELRVLQGSALCSVGDTVESGETLVAGITQQVVDLQKAKAQAEIYALTWHTCDALIPSVFEQRTVLTEEHRNYAVQIGRMRINLSGNSRICGTDCVRMINRKIMTLPGDYTLPVTWITETCRHYRTETQKLTKGESGVLLSGFAADTVMDAMVAGEILSREESVSVQNSSYRLTGVYACREMIAREKEVNLFGSEFDYGRTNSERGSD